MTYSYFTSYEPKSIVKKGKEVDVQAFVYFMWFYVFLICLRIITLKMCTIKGYVHVAWNQVKES